MAATAAFMSSASARLCFIAVAILGVAGLAYGLADQPAHGPLPSRLTTRVSIQRIVLDDGLIGMSRPMLGRSKLDMPASASGRQPPRQPMVLAVGLVTIALPSGYTIIRETDSALSAPFEFPLGDSSAGRDADTGAGLTSLVCGSQVFESAGSVRSATPAEMPRGLIPLVDPAGSPGSPESRGISPLAYTLSALWGRSEYLVSRLALAVILRATVDGKVVMNQMDPDTFSSLVASGRCHIRFNTRAEQQQQREREQAAGGSGALAPGSYVLVDVPSSAASPAAAATSAAARETLDGLRLPLTHRRAASQPADERSAPAPASTLASAAGGSAAVKNSFLFRQTTCRRAHRALGIASAFLASSAPLSPADAESAASATHPVFLQSSESIVRSAGKRANAHANANASAQPQPAAAHASAGAEAGDVEGVYVAPDSVFSQLYGRPITIDRERLADGTAVSLSSVSDSSRAVVDDEATAFVSVGTMVKGTNFGSLANPITKAVFGPLISIVAGMFLALTQYFMGKELPAVLDLGLHNLVSKELVGSLAQPMIQIFPFSLAEVMQDQLPPLVAHTVAEDVVKDITPRITRMVTERLHRVISRNIVLDSLRPATRQMNNQLGSDTAHILSLSLAATITPALLHTLSHNPQQDYFCYYCETKQLYCTYCHATRGRIARQNYYAEFYAGFYARYFTAYYRKYFVELEDAKQLEERMREHQIHFDQGWKQTPRLVLEEIEHVREPAKQYPRQTPPPPGVVTHGPGGTVSAGYSEAAGNKYAAFS